MFQRFLTENLKKSAQDTPVIMVCGARQTDKSTLLTGQDAFAFAKDMFLLPISALWELREP